MERTELQMFAARCDLIALETAVKVLFDTLAAAVDEGDRATLRDAWCARGEAMIRALPAKSDPSSGEQPDWAHKLALAKMRSIISSLPANDAALSE